MVRYLADLTADRRWELQVICRRDRAVDQWAQEISKHCTVFRIDVGRPADLYRMTGLVRAAGMVHLNLSFPTGKYPFATAALARSLGRPLVVTHHLALRVPTPWRQAMRRLGRAAFRHIAISHQARQFLIDVFGYSPDRVVVIHNGIDPTRFRPLSGAVRQTSRAARGKELEGHPWGDDVMLATVVARLSTQKGLFDLLEAAAIAVKKLPALRIVVIGEGDQRHSLQERIRVLGLEGHCYLPGVLSHEQVADWLGASDLFILPSRYEGGPPIALMEGMAAGCAVLATDVIGVRELITEPALGRIVPAEDSDALAAAMVELMSDPQTRAAMAERARLKVSSDFTIETSLHRTASLLEEVAAANHV
jgi:glycosyltransferase involved in cell wall biosynthesis